MRDFQLPGRSPVYAANAMAATSMPIATLTALDILRAGGNALDAAVAAVAVLGVVEPQSTGIGGDCFCLYAPAGASRPIAINGSGRAAGYASMDYFESNGIAAIENTSPHAVTVPGAVGAWEKLLAAHGRKGFDEVLQPAIRLAEEGFPVHPRVAFDWAGAVAKLQKGGADLFLPQGQAPKPGHMFVQKELGATLRAIAKHGAKGFYEGPVAADMLATLNARGTKHTEADFATGRDAAQFVDPISIDWREHDVFQCPPNGSGMIALMLLGLLGRMDTPNDGAMSVTRLHRHIEAARLCYRDRNAFLADPEHVDVPLKHLTSPAYLDALRALIRDDRAMKDLPNAGEAILPPHRDTVYLTVVDRDGNACSFINSLFEGFGSGILAQKSGVMLQNRGFGFRLERDHLNCIAPNKRPMHTIIPGMVMKDGRCMMPYGVMGGHFQPRGPSLFLSNMLEFGMDIQEAMDFARLMPSNGKVQVERGIPADVVAKLNGLGHQCEVIDKPHGGSQAILIDHARGVLCAGSDPRKDGCAMGY